MLHLLLFYASNKSYYLKKSSSLLSLKFCKKRACTQCCGSGMFIPDPGFYLYLSVFISHEFHKIEDYFIFEMLKKKIWPNFHRIIEVFT
jgi:hypothetical protein